MRMRSIGVTWVLLLAVVLSGCGKSEDKASSAKLPARTPAEVAPQRAVLPQPAPGTVARIHWKGKKAVAVDANAASLMEIWNLPETARVGQQVMEGLARAPWRLMAGRSTATNSEEVAGLIRPLLEDVLQEETYLELRGLPDAPDELALAVRVAPNRVGLWQTNVAAAVQGLGCRPNPAAPAGSAEWQFGAANPVPPLSSNVVLTVTGSWTVVSLSSGPRTLLGEILSSIQRTQVPYGAHAENWLQAEADLNLFAGLCGEKIFAKGELPRAMIAVNGDGKDVRTRGVLSFPSPLPASFSQWNIPTNLITEPLITFVAARGLKPLLESFEPWKKLGLRSAPDQFYGWSQQGVPFQTYFALPFGESSNFVETVANRLEHEANPWIQTNSFGTFERLQQGQGIRWREVVFATPILSATPQPGGPFLFGGLAPRALTNRLAPPELLAQVQPDTNLVWYDWEITGPRAHAWIDIAQLARLLSAKPQLPFKGVALEWLRAAESKLGNATTGLRKTGPNQLSFSRSSTVGLTSIEMQLLADWIESPTFPFGLHTFVATNLPPSAYRHRTNAPATR